MTDARRLLRYLVPYRAQLAVTLVAALGGVVVELARPWPVKIVVDYALSGRPLPARLANVFDHLPGGASQTAIIAWSVVAAIAIVVLSGALTFAVLMLTVSVGRRLVLDLAGDLLEKLQRLSLGYHGRHSVGDLLQRVANDTFVLFALVSVVAIPTIAAVLTLVGMFVIMSRLDLTLTLIALTVVPVLTAALALFTGPLNTATTKQAERQGALMALAEQNLFGMRVVQGFARESFMTRMLKARANELGAAFSTAARVGGGYNLANSVITGLGAAAILGVGAVRVTDGTLTLGDLLVFLGYLSALYVPVAALSTAVGTAVTYVAHGRRVLEVLDSDEELPESPGARRLERARGDVAFDSVSFGYDSERLVLHDISFEARAGQITAIVGVTGAGKTSLISLLSRFYDPSHGRVLLDGNDLRELQLRSVRENVSLVVQEPFLFPLTIAENIAFGHPGATTEDIVHAATIAQAHGFIQRLPEGYDTRITERAVALSGGEKQRIALARALLRDAAILVLDEPTSAVDAETEARIFEALAPFMRERTTFIISHRLSTILRADQIIALEAGRIVERGTHDDLIAKGDLYARLYRYQYLAAVDPAAAAS